MSAAQFTRRRLLQGSAMAAALAGAGTFFGPFQHNRAYAQAKPIKLGLTCDASGQYGASGAGRPARHPHRHRGGERQGRRARAQGRVDHGRHRDEPRRRQPRRRALHHPRGLPDPDRRAAFRRRQRDHAGREQIRHHLPQHELLGAERGRRELLARQVRVGRQRHQLLEGLGQERRRTRSARTGCF